MIQTHTPVAFDDLPNPINWNNAFMSFGSCFSAHIAEKCNERFFDVVSNPFGIS